MTGCPGIEIRTRDFPNTRQECRCMCFGKCCGSAALQGSRDLFARPLHLRLNWYIFHATVRPAAPWWWIEGLDEEWLHPCIMNEDLPCCGFRGRHDESAVDTTHSINESSVVCLKNACVYMTSSFMITYTLHLTAYSKLPNEKFWEELIPYFPLIRHGPNRKIKT
jgi:hypothetical protein